MKRLLLAMAIAGFVSAPVFAQAGPVEGPAEEKSVEELLKELHELMERASNEMGELEKELNRASLDAPKADVIAVRIAKLREAMEQGTLDEVPEGLARYLKENPDELAKASGKSGEEIRTLAESSKALEELLNQHPEVLKKLASQNEAIEHVQRFQSEAERKLEKTLKRQRDSARAANENVDNAIEIGHRIKAQSPWQGGGGGQPQNGQEQASDPRKGQEEQQSGNPNQGAQEQYKPGDGSLKQDEQTDPFVQGQGDSAQMDKKQMEMGDGASSEDRREPSKYKGFWEKFNREAQKVAGQKKD